MTNKKRYIIVTVLLLFIGLGIFTFAATPGDDNELSGNNVVSGENVAINNDDTTNNTTTDAEEDEDQNSNIANNTQNNNTQNNNDTQNGNDNNDNEPNEDANIVVEDEDYNKALAAVIKAEEDLDEDSYKTAMGLVELVNNTNPNKENLETRLSEVNNEIVAQLVDQLKTLTQTATDNEDKEKLTAARDFRTGSDVVAKVEALDNDLEETLENILTNLAIILDDTKGPEFNIEDGALLNSLTAIEVKDAEENEIISLILVDEEGNEVEFTKDLEIKDGTYTLVATDAALNDSRVTFTLDKSAPHLVLNGAAEMTIDAGSVYTEEGITVVDLVDGTFTSMEIDYMTYRPFGGDASKVEDKVVDTTKLGMYKIVYKYTDKAGNVGVDANRDDHDYVMRIVYVKDLSAPTLTLNGDSQITIEAGVDTYTELGATMVDYVDGTDTFLKPTKINYSINGEYQYSVDAVDLMVPGTYKVVYEYTDKAGNVGVDANRANHPYVMRIVVVQDTIAAKLTLNGAAEMTLEAGVDTYTELGATMVDYVDGTDTFLKPTKINYSINGEYQYSVDAVDLMVPGTYKVVYEYTDKAGNVGVDANRANHPYVMRIVVVQDTIAAKLTLNGAAEMTLEAGVDTYTELGATMVDYVDGTDTFLKPTKINYSINGEYQYSVDAVDLMVPGTYKVVYEYTDKAGNVGVDANRANHPYVMRTVVVQDTTPATITIPFTAGLNKNEMIVNSGDVVTIEDVMATVTDNVDEIVKIKPIRADLYISNKSEENTYEYDFSNGFDTNYAGRYNLYYEYEDAAGNISTAGMMIVMKDKVYPTVSFTKLNKDEITPVEYNGKLYFSEPVTVSFVDNVNIKTLGHNDWENVEADIKRTSWAENATDLGEHTIYVIDSSGNKTSVTFTIVENPELIVENGVMNITDDSLIINDSIYYDESGDDAMGNIINASGNVVINGNNKIITMATTYHAPYLEEWPSGYKAPTMTNIFASKNGSVVVNDLTIKGQMSSNTLGWYETPAGKNVLNNVNIIDTEVVSFSQVAAGLIVYGEAELNNTNVYGTKMSDMDTSGLPLYDLAVVNDTNVSINGGKYGSIYTWQGAKITFVNVDIDSILTRADQWQNRGNIVIGEGTTVKKLIVDPLIASNPANGFFPSVTIKAGAVVDVLDLSNTEYDNYVIIEEGAVVKTIIN